jgi:CzcA family heavy metal efflux pump
MMRWIVGSSLKFRRLIVALGAGVIVLGITQLGKTSVDVLPEFKPTQVEVQTEALGLSAEEVEQLITVPLEQDLLVGIAFLDEIESASIPGLSSIVMTFEPGTSVLDARQVVAERLTQAVGAAGLPQVAKLPQMIQPLSSTSRVSMVRLSSDELSPIQMSVLARWVILPRLLGVDGVANVALWGFRDRQLQVLVDPKRLRDEGVSLQQIIRTAGNALEVSPLTFLEASSPGTGGFIDTPNQRLHIFHEQAIRTAEDLAQVPVDDRNGETSSVGSEPRVTLGDVTEVVEDHQPLIGDARCGDDQCLLLVIEKFPGVNTLEVTRGVDTALEAMGPGLAGMEVDSSVYRPAEYIEESVGNLSGMLLIGAVLLVLLFGAFFFEWRSALISAVVVPMSLVAAGLVLYFRDATVNTMVVAGLLMALVAVIDDAVIDVDNIARRLRRHRAEGDGAPRWRVILEASLEMRGAMLFATLVVIAALLPVLFMDGVAGAFLPSIALSYVLAVAASMLVALTLTPALGALLLSNAPLERRESPLARWLQRGYEKVYSGTVRRPGRAYAALGAVLVAGLVALPFLDTSLRPSLKERDLLIHLEGAPGTSLPRMNDITAQAAESLESVPGVRGVGAHVGRAMMSDRIVNVNSSDIWVNVDRSADYDAALTGIREAVGGLNGISVDVMTYSQERATAVLEGPDHDVVVRVYGENEEILQEKAEELRGALSPIEGIRRPQIQQVPQESTIEVAVDLTRALRFGVNPGDVRRTAAILLSGMTVGNLFEEQKVFDVVVWGSPDIRTSVDDVRLLPIETPGGGQVALGEVADVAVVPNPTVIQHESVATYLDVTADVAGRDVGAVASDVERAIGRIEFPLEHHAEVLGGFAEREAAQTRVLTIGVAAAIGIFLLLQAAFSSWRLATLSFLTLPIALAGGLLAALAGGGTISLGSIAGLFAVLGLTARGSVALIRSFQHLERREGQAFGPELVLRGTSDRLPPILMTTVAAAVFFLPFLFTGDAAGFEVLRPMAAVIIGGVLTSALLNLIVVPALYLRYGYIAAPDTEAEDLYVTIPDVEPEPATRVGEGTTIGDAR